jgi:methylated-DNA-[protein]-cysteine S-methyltransferase
VKLIGTEFQQKIWHELLAIPYGQTSTYGELAALAGSPQASRAVGGAVGANPVPIIIPCHRILASDNKITGYSGGSGIPTKILLLEREGITYR